MRKAEVIFRPSLTIFAQTPNTSVLTFSPNTGSFGNVLLNGTVTTTATINNTPGNGTDVGTYSGAASNNGITAAATGSASPGNNTINVTLNANANGSGTAGNNSWSYTITNTSTGNTGTGDNKVLTMSANVGKAMADTTNGMTTFGPSLASTQVGGSSFDGLSLTVVGSAAARSRAARLCTRPPCSFKGRTIPAGPTT